MHGITPVKATTDNDGRAVVTLSEGNWWLRATASLSGGETIEWRLPINVAGQKQTVELTMEKCLRAHEEILEPEVRGQRSANQPRAFDF